MKRNDFMKLVAGGGALFPFIHQNDKVQPVANHIFNSLSDLKKTEPDDIKMHSQATLLGYYNPGDGGGGFFYWDTNSTEIDNGGTVFKPDSLDSDESGRWKRIFQRHHLRPEQFGAISGCTDIAKNLQRLIDYAANLGSCSIEIEDHFELERPLTIRRGPKYRKGNLLIYGSGSFVKGSKFSGDRILNIHISKSDEDYLIIRDITIDGVDKTVNGLDWFKNSIPYNATRTQHKMADSSYDKAVRLYGVNINNCYRGIRFSGNNTKGFGLTFRNNICGFFAIEGANDFSFHGSSFRRGDIGIHVATNNLSRTCVGGSYFGCTFESNSLTGLFWQGSGSQSAQGCYFENNGFDLSNKNQKKYPDWGSFSKPSHVRTSAIGGFCNDNIIQGGEFASPNNEIIYLGFAREMKISNVKGTTIVLHGSPRNAVFDSVKLNYSKASNSGNLEYFRYNGQRYAVQGNKVLKKSLPFQNELTQIISGSISGNSKGRKILQFSIPNENRSYAIEISGFANCFKSQGLQNQYEKKMLFINRIKDEEISLSESMIFSSSDSSAQKTNTLNKPNFRIRQADSKGRSQSQVLEIIADLDADTATVNLGVQLKITKPPHIPHLEIVSNELGLDIT